MFRTRNALQIVCLRIAVPFILVSILFLTVKWSKQEVLTGGNIFARPFGLAPWMLWSLLVCSLQQKYSFTTHNVNNKARCKNISYLPRWQFQYVSIESFLEWSQRQYRKTIETLKRTVSSPKICSDLAPGFATVPHLMHWLALQWTV